MSDLPKGHRLGHYTLINPLGRGGMGVVYRALDDRLGREVAVKMIAGLVDGDAQARFWREARTAASVNHPHVCQIFEVDEAPEGIFLAMELLEGEALDVRLGRGPVNVQEAVPIVSGILGALGALHARGLVHRDVKPSNVFLTPHGPKLLDFGLARSVEAETVRLDAKSGPAVTEPGMILGTPLYMAPEQVKGAAVDSRTDLYAAGAVLFHMLAGRPPFSGGGVDVMFAALHHHPPALEGPPAVVAIDRVIRRAMQKDPAARFETAAAMAAAVTDVSLSGATAIATPVRALTRIVVPPIRLAKADPDVAFLSFGLAEAVSGSLAALEHIIVRSPAVASGWAEDTGDPRKVAAEADVDLVIASRLLRSGPQLRITAQLLDGGGTVLGSTTVSGVMDDIFALEDAFSSAAVGLVQKRSLGAASPPPTPPTRRDVPATPRTFELYLRGMEHARHLDQTAQARDLFSEAVTEDPGFAPAWAALGRAHRVFGKYYGDRESNVSRAEDAFRRALELSPELPAAHRYLTHLEAEMGRADAAIGRLLKLARTNRRDPQLFAGLVHALRYGGLIDASLAAHSEARRLDPNVPTSIEYTRALLIEREDDATRAMSKWRPGDSLDGIWPLVAFGARNGGVLDAFAQSDDSRLPPGYKVSVDAAKSPLVDAPDEALRKLEAAVNAHVDPEAWFLFAVSFLRIGAVQQGLDVIERSIHGGYAPVSTLERSYVFDDFRDTPRFQKVLAAARERQTRARDKFISGGGPDLLGMP